MAGRLRIGMAFCAAIATAVTLGACGSGMPGNAIVQIGDATITKAELVHWLTVANDTTQLSSNTKAAPLPLPPDYTACVDAQLGSTGSTGNAGEIASLKSVCAQQYQQLLSQILNYLIFTIWVQGDAVDRGVSVTGAEINKAFEQARAASTVPLKTTAQLNHFLAETGQTINDLKWRTRINLLGNKIELKIAKQAGVVTAAQIASYYHRNIAQYTVASRRDIHLVLTTTLSQAQKVRQVLAGGASYASVASQYSKDPTTKSKGGQMLGVVAGELTPVASSAVFAAKAGALTGPVKTPFGYYVFTVDKVYPGSVESLAKATPSIRSLLRNQQQSTAVSTWQNSGLQAKWQPRTTCRSDYVVPYCSNAPKTSTTSGVG